MMDKINEIVNKIKKQYGLMIFLLTFFIIYWIDIDELFDQITQQRQRMQLIKQQINKNQALIAQQVAIEKAFLAIKQTNLKFVSANSTDLILRMIPAANLGGMIVQAIKPCAIRHANHKTKHFLTVTGFAELTQLDAFLSALS